MFMQHIHVSTTSFPRDKEPQTALLRPQLYSRADNITSTTNHTVWSQIGCVCSSSNNRKIEKRLKQILNNVIYILSAKVSLFFKKADKRHPRTSCQKWRTQTQSKFAPRLSAWTLGHNCNRNSFSSIVSEIKSFVQRMHTNEYKILLQVHLGYKPSRYESRMGL